MSTYLDIYDKCASMAWKNFDLSPLIVLYTAEWCVAVPVAAGGRLLAAVGGCCTVAHGTGVQRGSQVRAVHI